jgi:hypothetical protein
MPPHSVCKRFVAASEKAIAARLTWLAEDKQ